MYPESGYKTITPIQLCNALSALDSGAIGFRAFRVYLACFSLQAIREAASRTRKKQKRRGDTKPCYRVEEIIRLVSGSDKKSIRRDISRLERASLLTFTESVITVTETPLASTARLLAETTASRSSTRPIPVPRSVLRYLAGCQKPALVKTIIAYLLRGLSIDKRTGLINGKGTVKLSWIADVFGVSERAARYARGELVRMGWIGRDTDSFQRKLNRDGAYFQINLEWRGASQTPRASWRDDAGAKASEGEGKSRPTPQELLLKIAAPLLESCTKSAPPKERLKTPNGSKNQRTQGADPAGLQMKAREQKPAIQYVRADDLKCFYRTEELYWQAVRGGLVEHSEANALNWIAAAVRARSVLGDPVRVFLGIVRKQLWENITQEQEERARQALTRYRELDPMRFRVRRAA